MICIPKYLKTEVQLCRFIYYGCQFHINTSWGDILDLSESYPESCAGQIFAHTNIRLNGIWFSLQAMIAKIQQYQTVIVLLLEEN